MRWFNRSRAHVFAGGKVRMCIQLRAKCSANERFQERGLPAMLISEENQKNGNDNNRERVTRSLVYNIENQTPKSPAKCLIALNSLFEKARPTRRWREMCWKDILKIRKTIPAHWRRFFVALLLRRTLRTFWKKKVFIDWLVKTINRQAEFHPWLFKR